MAIPHAKPAEVIDVSPLGSDLKSAQTTTLVKTDAIEVIRLVLPVGKELKPHEVPGEITVQCLEGKVAFCVGDSECELTAGKLTYLVGSDERLSIIQHQACFDAGGQFNDRRVLCTLSNPRRTRLNLA